MTFSFPLRSISANGPAAPFLLNRFHGDNENRLVENWCNAEFIDHANDAWPLVLFGPTGTGKSALAETLVCRIDQDSLFLAADDFRRQFHAALATRSISQFRERLYKHPALVLDHLILPTDEQSLIREMVQLLDYFQQQHRPVIITTQTNPWMMGPPFGALRSRFCEGLVIQVNRPGPAAKRQIAGELLDRLNLKMLDEDLDWLVRCLPDTVPLIKSHLSRVALETNDSLLTRETLKTKSADNEKRPQTKEIKQLIQMVGRQFGQRVSDIMGNSRRKEVVRARSVAMFLARKLMDLTFRQTGEQIGKRDPSTARHACQSIGKAITTDSNLADAINRLSIKFGNHLEQRDNLND